MQLVQSLDKGSVVEERKKLRPTVIVLVVDCRLTGDIPFASVMSSLERLPVTLSPLKLIESLPL